jgi:hypothetical protein
MSYRQLSVLLVLTIILSACQSAPEWQTYTSAEGGFSAEMPGAPAAGVTTEQTPNGPVDVHSVRATRAGGAQTFQVTYSDYPDMVIVTTPEDTLLKNATVAAYQAAGGQIVSEQPLKLDDRYSGRELLIRTDAKLLLTMRFYLVHSRLYQLVAAVPDGEARDVVERFIYSFKLQP